MIYNERTLPIVGKMMVDLEAIVEDLEKWSDGKGAILYGAGDIFCSGGDLNFARSENNPQSGYEMSIFMGGMLRRFSSLPLVSVAFVNDHGMISFFNVGGKFFYRVILLARMIKKL